MSEIFLFTTPKLAKPDPGKHVKPTSGLSHWRTGKNKGDPVVEQWMIEADLYRHKKELGEAPSVEKRVVLMALIDKKQQLLQRLAPELQTAR